MYVLIVFVHSFRLFL